MSRILMPLVNGLVFVVVLLGLAKRCEAQSIRWSPSIEQAQKQAASENKFVLLHFGADYCAPCRDLESYVFTNSKVIFAIQDHFVPVKIDIQAQPELAEKYAITRIPQDLVLTSDGQVVFRRLSPNSAANYKTMLNTGIQIAAQSTPQARRAAEALSGITEQQWEERTRSPFFGSEAAKSGSLATLPPAQQSIPHRTGVLPPAGVRPSPSAAPETFAAGSIPQFPDHSIPETQYPGSNFQPRGSLPAIPNAFADSVNRSGLPPSLPPVGGNNRVGGLPDSVQGSVPTGQSGATVKALFQEQESSRPLQASKVPATYANEEIRQVSGYGVEPKSPVGLEGYCPVALLTEQKWSKGDTQIGCHHRGVLYLFSNQSALEQFLASPDELSPLLGGFDPVIMEEERRLQPGKRRYGVFCETAEGQMAIVLFENEKSRDRFKGDSLKYLELIRQITAKADQASN